MQQCTRGMLKLGACWSSQLLRMAASPSERVLSTLATSPFLQAALAGDPHAQFQHALHLQSTIASGSVGSVVSEASSAADVLKEVKVIQVKARKSKRERMKMKTSGAPTPVRLEEGSQVQNDPAFWLRSALDGGHSGAGVALANKLFDEGSKWSVAEAMELYEEAAADGHVDACFNLGNAYFQGVSEAGLQIDLPKSMQYFERGAHAGDASCQYWLGYCHASGEGGVDRVDIQRGIAYLLQAAEQKHPAAHYYLSMIYRGAEGDREANLEQFRHHLQLAFDAGDADAAFCLAELYMTGSDGFPLDSLRSRDMLVEAVDRGHAEAAMSLGAVYYRGSLGVPADQTKAFQLYSLAADRGYQDAWKNIAAMYATGEGVEKSEETAKYILKVVFKGKDDRLNSAEPSKR